MRVIYVLLVLAFGGTVLLWLGLLGRIKQKIALAGALICLTAGCGALAVAVLPGNSVYGPTVTRVVRAGEGTVGMQAEVITTSGTAEKTVFLTFDDGPYPPYTQALLAALKKEGVQATFFMVGQQAEGYPELVRQIADAGHTIGLHAYRHRDFLKLSSAEQRQDLLKGRQVLEALSGKKVRYWRPPHGFRDGAVMATAEDLGLKVINWNVIPRDWTGISAGEIAERVVDKVEPGSIVLLHDGDSPRYTASRQPTVEAATRLIPELKKQGYHFSGL